MAFVLEHYWLGEHTAWDFGVSFFAALMFWRVGTHSLGIFRAAAAGEITVSSAELSASIRFSSQHWGYTASGNRKT